MTDYGDEPLILEPVVQGFNLSDYAYVYAKNGKEYISLPQMSAYLGLKYKIDGNMITAQMADDEDATIIIDMAQRTVTAYGSISSFAADEMTVIDGTVFFAADFYIRLLKMQIKIDKLNMQMTLDREKDFPTTAKLNAEKKRGKGSYNFQQDSFSNYEFDNRWFGEPVVDITLGKGWGRSNDTGKSFNSDAYSVNLAMIAGGLDVNTYIYGDSYSDRNPRVRISGSRTFLDEPENKFNLKTLKVGDISGLSSSYFADASYGRGAAVSSFKNLVMSANKTIDITGPLLDGWQVELYWNEQLVGYRQNGVNGQYNFPNMPVSYGLNTFKLVFYGPYGETRTEYERYYSGTSPVKKGEFGYTAAAYQPYRYLIEDNEPFEYEGKETPIIDLTGYYGATDNLTLMGGFTQKLAGSVPVAVSRRMRIRALRRSISAWLAPSMRLREVLSNIIWSKTWIRRNSDTTRNGRATFISERFMPVMTSSTISTRRFRSTATNISTNSLKPDCRAWCPGGDRII